MKSWTYTYTSIQHVKTNGHLLKFEPCLRWLRDVHEFKARVISVDYNRSSSLCSKCTHNAYIGNVQATQLLHLRKRQHFQIIIAHATIGFNRLVFFSKDLAFASFSLIIGFNSFNEHVLFCEGLAFAPFSLITGFNNFKRLVLFGKASPCTIQPYYKVQ